MWMLGIIRKLFAKIECYDVKYIGVGECKLHFFILFILYILYTLFDTNFNYKELKYV